MPAHEFAYPLGLPVWHIPTEREAVIEAQELVALHPNDPAPPQHERYKLRFQVTAADLRNNANLERHAVYTFACAFLPNPTPAPAAAQATRPRGVSQGGLFD